MENSNQKSAWQAKLSSLLGAATIFFIVVSAVAAVEFFNRLKENRYIGPEPALRSEITVTGQSEKFIQPELATIELGVKTEAGTVDQATAENTEKMNQIIAALKDELGLEDEEIKTTRFNLAPRYEWHETRERSTGERTLAGYEVEQALEVKIRDFELIGQAVQQATRLGANQIGSLRFSIEDEEAVKEELRAEAIAQARDKAGTLARQLDVSLVRITDFREDRPIIPWAREAGDMVALEEAETALAPSIQPGENRIEVEVNITYEIN